MKVTTTMNKGALRTLSESQAKAVTLTAIELLSRVRNAGTMPMDTGNLQNESSHVDSSKVKSGIVSIVSDTPYSRRLYFHPEYNFNTSKNANAGGEWWEPYLTGEQAKVPAKLFKEFMRRQSGGIIQ